MKRDKRVDVRVTATEKERFKRLAELNGLGLSNYIRMSLLRKVKEQLPL